MENTGNTVENLLALQAVQLVFEGRWELGIDHDDDSAIHCMVFILRIRFIALTELIQLLAERFLDQLTLHLLHGTRVGVGKHAGMEANKEGYPSMSSM